MSRREWLRAMRGELAQTSGRSRLSWLLGIAWVAAVGLIPLAVAAGVVVGVVGGTFGTTRSSSRSSGVAATPGSARSS